MNDKIKNLEFKLKKAKQSYDFVAKSIELALSRKEELLDSAKHILFQYQVLLESNGYLLETYEIEVIKLCKKNIANDDFEYTCRVLDNLIADHQAKAISIDNILKRFKL